MPTHHVDRSVAAATASARSRTGLILTGGGARAAYQVGVLRAVLHILDPQRHSGLANPFHIICGTSAGAINAAALACRAHRPHQSLRRLDKLWSSLATERVYRTDASSVIKSAAHWLGLLSLGWMFPGAMGGKPRSLLDNSPLAELLSHALDFRRLNTNLAAGHLSALAITATGYNSGQHLTFFQSVRPIEPWRRALREAVPARISVDHLMASSAIPFIFPARMLQVHQQSEWCGDGSMRQLAPISPAIHLGADRVLVVGTSYRDDTHPEARSEPPPYPSLAQVGGHALNTIFQDSVARDVETLERLNRVRVQCPGPDTDALRRVDVLAISPSRSLDHLALEHLREMPRATRALFRVLGISADRGPSGGGSFLSYLLFEASYTRQLIELGYADTMRQTDKVAAFFTEVSG